MASILVVDDEPTLVDTLRYNLVREGYRVWTAADGEQALAVARAEHPDLLILDVMLPGLSGFDVCRILRHESVAPILMLTAKDDLVDKVVGLEVGADDYLTKPFALRELLARVHALLRRSQTYGATEEKDSAIAAAAERLTLGDLVIDLKAHEVTRAGKLITLKPKTFDLLAYLVRNVGRAVSRDVLLDAVWGYDFVGDTRTVDVHIRWLRQQIEDKPGDPTRLLTVRGVGYRLVG